MSPESGPRSDLELETLSSKPLIWPFKSSIEGILVNIMASHGLTQLPTNLSAKQGQEAMDLIYSNPFELNDKGQEIMDALQEALAGAKSLKPSWPPIEDPTNIGKRTLSMFGLRNPPSKSEFIYFLKEFIPDIRELSVNKDWVDFVKKYGLRLGLAYGYFAYQSGVILAYTQRESSHDLLEKITPGMALFAAFILQAINLVSTYQVAKTEDQIPINMFTALANDFLNSLDSSEKLKRLNPFLVLMVGAIDKLQYEFWKIPTAILMGPEFLKAIFIAESLVTASEITLNQVLVKKAKDKAKKN